MMKLSNMLRDQRGAASYVFIILFMMFLVLAGLVIDGGRFLIARAQLQTLADASSLAGAMTAEAIPEKELEIMQDESGQVTGIKEKITGYRIFIDPEKARKDALDTAYLNGGPEFWESQGGYFTLEEAPVDNNAGWDGWVLGEDAYYTRARVLMKPGFFAPILNSFSSERYVPVYIDSMSRAYVVADEK
jgi:hypothetical protein